MMFWRSRKTQLAMVVGFASAVTGLALASNANCPACSLVSAQAKNRAAPVLPVLNDTGIGLNVASILNPRQYRNTSAKRTGQISVPQGAQQAQTMKYSPVTSAPAVFPGPDLSGLNPYMNGQVADDFPSSSWNYFFPLYQSYAAPLAGQYSSAAF